MTSKKFFYVMVGVLVLMVGLVIGSVVMGDKLLQKQADKLVALKVDDEVLDMQQRALRQAKKDVETYNELGSIAKQVVPQDKDQARAVREIVSIADQAGVSIASVSFPSSNLGQKAAPKPKSDDEKSSSTAKSTTSPITQAKPVTGIGGVYQLDITVTSDPARPTPYSRFINFLTGLEQNRRTAQVSNISIQPNTENRNNLGFTLTLTVFIKP